MRQWYRRRRIHELQTRKILNNTDGNLQPCSNKPHYVLRNLPVCLAGLDIAVAEWTVWGTNPAWEWDFPHPASYTEITLGMDGLGIESRWIVWFSLPSLLHRDYATEWTVWGSNPGVERDFPQPTSYTETTLRNGRSGNRIPVGADIFLTRHPIQWVLGLFWR